MVQVHNIIDNSCASDCRNQMARGIFGRVDVGSGETSINMSPLVAAFI